MNALARSITMAIGLLLAMSEASAFWSNGSTTYKVHQTITSDALGAPVYNIVSGQPSAAFTTAAITVINESHRWADSDPYAAKEHFDSESFQAAYNLLALNRVGLIALLNDPSNQTDAWHQLGFMLHQIQDFYSHSSWDAKNPATGESLGPLVHFGAATAPGGLMPSVILPEAQIGTVCNSDASTLTSNSNVTTGYYAVAFKILGVPVYQKSAPSGKCEHGSLIYAAASGCTLAVVAGGIQPITDANFVPDGISRDHPCFSAYKNVKEFQDAKGRAFAETQEFVQSIVTQLVTAGNAQGACTLLGIDPASAVCLTPCVPAAGAATCDVAMYTIPQTVVLSNTLTGTETTVPVECGTSSSSTLNTSAIPLPIQAATTSACKVNGVFIPKTISWSYNTESDCMLYPVDSVSIVSGSNPNYSQPSCSFKFNVSAGGAVSFSTNGSQTLQDSGLSTYNLPITVNSHVSYSTSGNFDLSTLSGVYNEQDDSGGTAVYSAAPGGTPATCLLPGGTTHLSGSIVVASASITTSTVSVPAGQPLPTECH